VRSLCLAHTGHFLSAAMACWLCWFVRRYNLVLRSKLLSPGFLELGRFHCFSGYLVFLSTGCCYPVSLASFAFPWDSLVGDRWCRDRFVERRTPSKFFSGQLSLLKLRSSSISHLFIPLVGTDCSTGKSKLATPLPTAASFPQRILATAVAPSVIRNIR